MMGYDTNPAFSLMAPDLAKYGARRLSRPATPYYYGYEERYQARYLLGTRALHRTIYLAPKWQGNPLYSTTARATQSLFHQHPQRHLTPLTNYQMADVVSFSGNGEQLLFGLQSYSHPTQLHLLQLGNNNQAPLKAHHRERPATRLHSQHYSTKTLDNHHRWQGNAHLDGTATTLFSRKKYPAFSTAKVGHRAPLASLELPLELPHLCLTRIHYGSTQ